MAHFVRLLSERLCAYIWCVKFCAFRMKEAVNFRIETVNFGIEAVPIVTEEVN